MGGGGRLLGPSQACGPSVHVAQGAICPIGLICRWAEFSNKEIQGDLEKSLHPSELWFSLAAWVPTRGLVPPGPPVHSCCHWALALSSSLCTVLYSTWKCWWGTQHIRGQGHQRATLPPRFLAQQLTWTAVYAMPRYAPMHTASSRSKMAGLTLKDSP